MGYKGLVTLGAAAAGAVVGGFLSLVYKDMITGYPPRGTSALVFDLNVCPFDYGKIAGQWLEAEGQSRGMLALLRGSKILHRLNPEGPTSTGMLALPDLDGNGRFGPTLEGCGAVIHNYDWRRSPEENLDNLRGIPEGNERALVASVARSRAAFSEGDGVYRVLQNNFTPRPQNHSGGRVISRTGKG